MTYDFDWQKAIHDPCFWALRYGEFPGVTRDEVNEYIEEYDFLNLAILEEDPLAGYVGEGDDPELANVEVGYRRLAIPFPEDYVWQMDFAAEEGESLTGIYHAISHPELDLVHILPTSTGLSLAEESGHERLPGLRWAELKQIESCLTRQGFDLFDVQALVPLLYPVVDHITFDELEDVRRALSASWQGLRILNATQAEQWLDWTITVYHQGQVLWLNEEKKWIELNRYDGDAQPCDLWTQTDGEWQTISVMSERHTQEEARRFSRFFSMLKRYS